MGEPVHYPPPDFDCPPANSFNLASRSSFHANMWSWTDSPTEPSWGSKSPAAWHQGAVTTSYTSQGSYTQGRHNAQTSGRGWQSYNPTGNHGKRNKKEPEYPFFCDTCDRGFKNHEKYGEHMAQHVKCSVPDCSFTAHEKIVSIHWKNNHAPGAKRIKLDTPEEIAKWREERRRNYPTMRNIEKKMKVMEEREVTGAVLETAQFGRMRGRGRGRRWMHGRGNRGRQHQGTSDRNTTERPPTLTRPSVDGDPLGTLVSNDHDSDKDEPSTVVVPPKQMSSALACLVASYGSASESDEEPGASPLKRAQQAVQENQDMFKTSVPQQRKLFDSTEMSSKISCDVSANGSELHSPHANKRGRRGRGGRGRRTGRGGHQDTPQQRRPTLLEMLLATDVRHERNTLLQCVRFVVQNNFFRHESEPQNGPAVPCSSDLPRKEAGDTSLSQRSSLISKELTTIDNTTVCEHSPDQSKQTCLSEDHTTEDLISNTEENNTASTNLSSASTPMYDDEIWESHVVTG